MRMFLLVAALLGLVALAAPTAAQPAGDPVPKILEAWKKRQTAFKTVRYVVTGKVEVFFLDAPTPDLVARLPKTPAEYPYRSEVLLDLSTGRFSHSSTRSVASMAERRFVEESGTFLFDGTRLMSGAIPGQSKPMRVSDDVSITTGNLSRSVFDIQIWPIFHAHGVTPTARHAISPKRLKASTTDDSFVFRGQTTQGNVNCTVLKSEPLDSVPAISDELLVDQKRDAAVIRHTYFTGKQPMARLDVAWKPHGATWLPSEWTCTWSDGGKVQSKHHLRVERVELDPTVKDEDFHYPIRPGMTVAEYDIPEPGSGLDTSRPSVKKYVAGDGGRQTVTEEAGKTTLAGEQLSPERSWAWLWWTIGGVLLTAFAWVVYVRRSRILPS